MFEEKRKVMVSRLCTEGYIRSEPVKKAFLTIARECFVPEHLRHQAYIDTPLDIGSGQTISAPHMVALMCEALDLDKGQKILEIGTGSGYHAAIVGHIVGEKGHVYTVERIAKLAEKAEENVRKTKIHNITIVHGDGSLGLEKYQPYDRIYVTCASPDIPPPLVSQLKENGKLLLPIGDLYCVLTLIEKKKEKITSKNLGGCVFVPLIGQYGHQN
ncbi:MAG: protein-L-isoaspartate O-methyltransferase [Candidatus Thermoplasmatota archaeon]